MRGCGGQEVSPMTGGGLANGGAREGVATLSSPGSERRPSEPPCLYRGEGGSERGETGGGRSSMKQDPDMKGNAG